MDYHHHTTGALSSTGTHFKAENDVSLDCDFALLPPSGFKTEPEADDMDLAGLLGEKPLLGKQD